MVYPGHKATGYDEFLLEVNLNLEYIWCYDKTFVTKSVLTICGLSTGCMETCIAYFLLLITKILRYSNTFSNRYIVYLFFVS